MKIKAWAIAALLATLPAAPVRAGVFYSPVFNMPLQPAPSTFDGGFYTVMPNGVVYGPNYYLVPPFNPTSGFDNVFVGQRLFGKLYEECITGKDAKGKQGGGNGAPGDPPRKVGVGGYTLDYSDPETVKNFDATAPMLNGYVPFAPMQQQPQQYGNGSTPLPRYIANYPNFQAPSPYPAHNGYGYRPAGMISQGPTSGVSQAAYYYPGYSWPGYYGPGYGAASYGPGYYGPSYNAAGYNGPGYGAPGYYNGGYYGPANYGAYGQEPIRQVQAAEFGSPPPMAMPFPHGMPQGGMYPNPYNQGCMNQVRVSLPIPPNYTMQQPCFPTLPNPCYEPPPCADNPNLPRYFTSSVTRSPRDFFMWKDVQDDKAQRQRLPLTVPQ